MGEGYVKLESSNISKSTDSEGIYFSLWWPNIMLSGYYKQLFL